MLAAGSTGCMADRLRDATLHSAVTVSTSRPDTPPARALAPVGSLGDRIANIGVTVVPLLLLGFAIYIAWGGTLHWQDLVVLAIVYVPVGLGVALTGEVTGGLTAMLWGGAVRIVVCHHLTFSINSLCHFFGRRRYETGDESRNLAWLAPFTFGEAWHNNHHAFPTSARHGLGRRQPDPGAWLIAALERCHLAWDVVRIRPERQQTKRTAVS